MTSAKTNRARLGFALALLVAVLLTACGGGGQPATTAVPINPSLPSYMNTANERYNEMGGVARPANAIDVYIAYSPESQQYMPRIIAAFNQASAAGTNPVTGQAWAAGERPIFVAGQQPTSGSSGSLAQGIINAIIAPSNALTYHPTIFQPSVSHWLALVNFQAGREVFRLNEAQATALSPVIIGMWESRYQAIQQTLGREDISWNDLLAVLNSPNGWQDFGIPNGRRAVYYGHANPTVSSTGLSTMIAEFYACAAQNGFTDRRLSAAAVNSPEVQECVRTIEGLIRHYSNRTEDFLEYIARGPDYLDFVALEETDLICLNRGATQGDEVCTKPQERLIAIYPSEGTFWHEHSFGIVNADWVTPEQQAAAQVFTNFVLTEPMQRIIMSEGFRPANPDVPLEDPFIPENGVDPAQPRAILDVPAPEVLAAAQASWSVVKKQADVMILIDVSGSMSSDGKLDQAKAAALAFLDAMAATGSGNRVGLTVFSDGVRELVPLGNFETVDRTLRSNISALRPEGGTEMFQAIQLTVEAINNADSEGRIRSVVLLSDGADTGDSGVTLQDAINAVNASRETTNPVILVPVAYGADADVGALNNLARASATRVQSGDPNNIRAVLQVISSYF